jgi:hypothetical protein
MGWLTLAQIIVMQAIFLLDGVNILAFKHIYVCNDNINQIY